MPSTTQNGEILRHLLRGGSLTQGEALPLFGCSRLGGRIWDLRRDGYPIIKETVAVAARGGRTAWVAKYTMSAEFLGPHETGEQR